MFDVKGFFSFGSYFVRRLYQFSLVNLLILNFYSSKVSTSGHENPHYHKYIVTTLLIQKPKYHELPREPKRGGDPKQSCNFHFFLIFFYECC